MFTRYQYFVYFHTKHLRLAVAIFILYSYCGNDVIVCCFTSKQHPYLTKPPACMRDPACNRGPVSIGTSESDPGLYAGPGIYPGPASSRCFTAFETLYKHLVICW